jgi:hypothetical protein
MSVYFDYQGKVPPNEYHYIVEVSKKDASGARSPDQLRIAAASVLINGLSVPLDGVLTPVEIEKTRFNEMAKEEIFRGTDGAIYAVIQETTTRL